VADTARLVDARLAEALPGSMVYAVGGRVRDEIRTSLDGVARPAKDLDYVVTGISLGDLTERLRRLGPASVVGASFAVVKATVDGVVVDVAVPRRERSTGLGHRDFTVEAGPDISLEDDLARRDFRMNMMARSVADGRLVDPYGGEADIRAGRIDVLQPDAFSEDPLRMLRAAQFAARFEFEPSALTWERMGASAALVATVSAERVRDELLKLFSAKRPSIGLEVLRRSGVLAWVLPELLEGLGVEQNEFHAYDVYHHNLTTLDAAAGPWQLRLAALLHDVGKPRTKDGPHFYRHDVVGEAMARDVAGRLRLPKDDAELVASLVRRHMYATDDALSDGAVRRFIRRVGPERVELQFALRHADIAGSGLPKRDDGNERFEARVRSEMAAERPFSAGDLAVDGNDVLLALERARRIAKGSRGGPAVGQILSRLLEDALDDPETNERSAQLRRIEALVEDLGPSKP